MQDKDYYEILGLTVPATESAIKKAYRTLAQQYHPDKTSNDPAAGLKFAEIKEAYENLINPTLKERYHQQRWYEQSMGRARKGKTVSPVGILKRGLELEKYIASLDVHRLDRPGLLAYLLSLLNNESLEMLNAEKDATVNAEISRSLLDSACYLDYLSFLIFYQDLDKLEVEPEIREKQLLVLKKQLTRNRNEKWRIACVLLVLAALVLLIYLLT